MERPYEKLELYGEKALSNAELLSIIIKTGTKNISSIEIANKILKLNNKKDSDLMFLQEASIVELQGIKGIGKVKAIQLKAVVELSIRMNQKSNYQKIQIKEPQDVAKIFMTELRNKKREIAKIVILNNKNLVDKIVDISLGGNNFASIDIKDILHEAVKMQAPKIILVHNHPSGDPSPSKSDIDVTIKLRDASEMLDIKLLDHIVIGDMRYTSIFTQMLKD
ncbi:hypothetical protein D3C87_1489640 [compost metagenome]